MYTGIHIEESAVRVMKKVSIYIGINPVEAPPRV